MTTASMCQWPNVYCQPAQQYCLVLEVASYNHRVLHSTNNARAAIKQMKVKINEGIASAVCNRVSVIVVAYVLFYCSIPLTLLIIQNNIVATFPLAVADYVVMTSYPLESALLETVENNSGT